MANRRKLKFESLDAGWQEISVSQTTKDDCDLCEHQSMPLYSTKYKTSMQYFLLYFMMCTKVWDVFNTDELSLSKTYIQSFQQVNLYIILNKIISVTPENTNNNLLGSSSILWSLAFTMPSDNYSCILTGVYHWVVLPEGPPEQWPGIPSASFPAALAIAVLGLQADSFLKIHQKLYNIHYRRKKKNVWAFWWLTEIM